MVHIHSYEFQPKQRPATVSLCFYLWLVCDSFADVDLDGKRSRGKGREEERMRAQVKLGGPSARQPALG